MNTVSEFFNNLFNKNKNTSNSNNTHNSNNSRKTMSYGFKPGPQTGGMASIKYNVLTQPSVAIMNWATTAGIPKMLGGKRSKHSKRSKRSNKKHSKKRRTRKHK